MIFVILHVFLGLRPPQPCHRLRCRRWGKARSSCRGRAASPSDPVKPSEQDHYIMSWMRFTRFKLSLNTCFLLDKMRTSKECLRGHIELNGSEVVFLNVVFYELEHIGNYIRHRLNGHWDQRVPSLFLATSSGIRLDYAVLGCMFLWRARYPLSWCRFWRAPWFKSPAAPVISGACSETHEFLPCAVGALLSVLHGVFPQRGTKNPLFTNLRLRATKPPGWACWNRPPPWYTHRCTLATARFWAQPIF